MRFDDPHDAAWWCDPSKLIVGVDEVGYGAWAGPVVVGCTYVDQRTLPYLDDIDDSKALSPAARRRIVRLLMISPHVYWSLGHATAQEIDQLSLGQATFLAIHRALAAFKHPIQGVIIDGVRAPKLPWPQQTLIRGDAYHPSIGAASLIAKVMRDSHMDILNTCYPHFGWATNRGYGTALHRKALQNWGPSPHHRLSYKPFKQEIQTLF